MDGNEDNRGHHNIVGIGKWYGAHHAVGNQLSLRPRQPDREAFEQKSFGKNVWAKGN
jgi:hypothetical protein